MVVGVTNVCIGESSSTFEAQLPNVIVSIASSVDKAK